MQTSLYQRQLTIGEKAGRVRVGIRDAGGDRAHPCSPSGVISKTARSWVWVRRFMIGVVVRYLRPSRSIAFSANSCGPQNAPPPRRSDLRALVPHRSRSEQHSPIVANALDLARVGRNPHIQLTNHDGVPDRCSHGLAALWEGGVISVLVPLQRRKGVRVLLRHDYAPRRSRRFASYLVPRSPTLCELAGEVVFWKVISSAGGF